MRKFLIKLLDLGQGRCRSKINIWAATGIIKMRTGTTLTSSPRD